MNHNDVFEETLAFFQAVRRYGVAPEHVFVSNTISDPQTREVCVGLIVRVPGSPEWSCCVAPCRGFDFEAFVSRWKLANTTPESDFKRMWEKHMPLERFTALCASLLSKGVPCNPSFPPR
jgi:hypothetical protein